MGEAMRGKRSRRPAGAAVAVLLATIAAAAIAGCGAGVVPPIHSESERFDVARRSMERGDYNIAIDLLKTYIQNNTGSAQVDEAIDLLGESYLAIRDWPSAAVEFERVLRDYPESDSSGAAAFELGEAYWGQSRGPDFDQEYTLRALSQWQSYLRGYPDHWRRAEAERRVAQARTRLATKAVHTGQLYLKLKLPGPAKVYFSKVIEDFSDTPVVGDAMIGLAMADAKQGRKAQAIERLREIESENAGKPLAARAAHERARLER